MPFKPVDATITVVLGPLIDDSDFKTRQETIAHDAAGMEIDVIIERSDGTVVTTSVTPTDGGDYDWTHLAQGYYALRIPASGGATCNNTEEGTLTAIGHADGVLPFRSQPYDIVPGQIYDSLVAGTERLAVDTEEIDADVLNEIADTLLARNVANVEATAAEHSLCTIVLATLESSIADTTWTIRRTDGGTTHAVKTVTANAAANPITGVD